ncbi:MAG: Translocon-associated protein beta (TRAPB) [Methanosaeta sp. PtaU1.Bin112]|nr:MAG: Translocon-associated protein beta (TRAPB) [Methanosaeta sp. PtaU1.Bin112]
MRRLIYLLCFAYLMFSVLLMASAYGKDDSDDSDEVTFKDFTLNIGDRIDLDNYRIELIEIQSIRDGLVVIRASKVGGSLDEQRALLLDSSNNFDGGADDGGITVTVSDIFDEQSARVRIEYQKGLGTPRKHVSDRPAVASDRPELSVQKSFDKDQISVGDEVKVTITVKNIGTGQAMNIKAEDIPPLPEFSYVVGYPPKIKETLESGESDSAVYVMDAVKEGSIRVPAMTVSYTDSKKNAKSNSSDPFNIIIIPKSKADLVIEPDRMTTIPLDGESILNISIANRGTASATRIEAVGTVTPSEGLVVTGLDESFFEIAPGGEVNYSAGLSGENSGDYTIRIKVNYDGGDGSVIREASAQVVVLEREYKYQYLLLIIPIAIIIAWIYRRYRVYKY